MSQLVADGDSITAGAGVTPYTSFLSLNSVWNIFNEGAAGALLEGVGGLTALAPSRVDTLYVAGNMNIDIIWAGTNDLCNQANGNAAATFASLTQYCLGRRAVGFKVIVVPMISRTGGQISTGLTNDQLKNWYNDLIYNGWQRIADAIVYLPSILTADGAYANSTYFMADGIHPTELSQTTLIAPAISAIVNQVARSSNLSSTVIPQDSRSAGVLFDSRTSSNIPVDSRQNIPQNSRNINPSL